MKSQLPIRLAAVSSLSLLVAACGGNGHHDDDPGDGVPEVPNAPVPLAGKADVQREVGNFIDVYGIFFGTDSTAGGMGKAMLKSAAVTMDSGAPKAASTSSCEKGGTVTEDGGTVTRPFEYFEVSPSVEFSTSLYSGCKTDDGDGDGTFTEANGSIESGGGAGTSAFYSYIAFGKGDDAYTGLERSTESKDEYEFESILGLFETATGASSVETRHVYTLRFEEEDDEEGHTAGQVTQGTAATPFVTVVNGSGVAVSGPYEYATTECEGGKASIATPTPVAFDDQDLPVGGAITVTSGTSSATITFANDGSATYQLSSGATGTLTRAEIVAATDGC